MDTRTQKPGDAFFALRGNRFDGNQFVAEAFKRGASVAVASEAHSEGPCIIADDPPEALQTFAAFHRNRYTMPLLALTGSCGKTMTKDLTAAVLETKYRVVWTKGNFNNEIGCPLSLLQIDADTEFAVIEMGANHPGEIARLCELARPTESAITLVAPAHLEGFGSIENVARAKAEIIAGLQPGGTFYLNTDDAWCVRMSELHAVPKVRFGRSGDVALRSLRTDDAGETVLDIEPIGMLRLPLVCQAHASNVLLAIAVGLRHGIEEFEEPLRAALAASTRFKVLHIGSVEVLDDTYNANPASVAAALRTLAARPGKGPRIAALGEMLELGAAAGDLHRQVGALAGGLGITHLFARGLHAADMVAAARAADLPHAEALDSHEAIAEAIRAVAQPGSVVLVKGSRGMAMERVIDALKQRLS
jgi:UDP-N-acetylmuramoyl-tripeptide--D-alanyl-D-alanine ligase